MHIVKYRDCLLRAVQNSRTDQDAILDAESGGSTEHVLHGV